MYDYTVKFPPFNNGGVINISLYLFMFLFLMRTLRFYSLSKLQLYSTVLSAIVTTFYTRSLDLTAYFLYPLIH